MGGLIICMCGFSCFKDLKPRYIEISILICNSLEIGFLIFLILIIPWGSNIKSIGKIFFFLMLWVIILNFIFLLILMCLRCSNKINTSENTTGICLCFTMIILDLLFEINIFYIILIIVDDIDKMNHDYSNNDINLSEKNSKYSRGKWAIFYISFIITEISLIFHDYFTRLLSHLITIKTNLSFSNYIDQQKSNDLTTTANIFNIPQSDLNINQITINEYDKDKHPFYYGNNQNIAQNHFTSNLNISNTPINERNNSNNIFPPFK